MLSQSIKQLFAARIRFWISTPNLYNCCWILRILLLCSECGILSHLVGPWGSAWKFPQGSITLEFDLCIAVSPIRKVDPDRSIIFQPECLIL